MLRSWRCGAWLLPQGNSPLERCPARSPTSPVPRCRTSHHNSGCRGARRATGATGDFAFLPPRRRLRDHHRSERIRAGAASRARAGRRAGQRLFHLHAANLEETIVTAARMGQRDVQTLPMAITALSNSELARLGTSTLGEAAALAPSVTFSQNVGFAQLTIRGIGANVVYAGSDPSSAMYLDGVYLARPAMEFVQFLDLDRVEVLRGPQGTLYGRNAVGGAVNLISRPPTNDFRGVRRFHRRELRRASRQRACQRADQTRPRDGLDRVHAGHPRWLRPRPRASGPSAWRR